MNTTSDEFSSHGPMTSSRRVPRLPQAPGTRLEGPIHLALGLAAVAMVWLLLATITQFVPRAGVFASRLRQTPEMLVSPACVRRNPDVAPGGGAVPGLTARPGVNGQRQMSNTTMVCTEPVS